MELLAGTASALACTQFQRDRGLFELHRNKASSGASGKAAGTASARFASVVEVLSDAHVSQSNDYAADLLMCVRAQSSPICCAMCRTRWWAARS